MIKAMNNGISQTGGLRGLAGGALILVLGLIAPSQANANAVLHMHPAGEDVYAETRQRLADYFSRCSTHHICNGAILVAEKGSILFQHAEGYVDASSDKQLSPSHVFDIGSVTKQFTAMAIMRLKDEGKLDFDDPIRTYLPELPYDGITIRNLLTHTSGLPEALGYYSGLYRAGKVTAPILNDNLIEVLATEQLPVRFAPFAKWEYNNTGYTLLASIIERISGKSYPAFLEGAFFAPLGMGDTLARTPDNEQSIVRRAYGFRLNVDASRSSYDQIPFFYLLGGGGLYSTVADLYKWDRAITSGALVSSETWQEATKAVGLANGGSYPYGFGWSLKPSKAGNVRVAHSGHWRGFKAAFDRLPASDRTIIMLTNNGADDSVDQAVADMEAILMGSDVSPLKPSIVHDLYRVAGDSDAAGIKSFYASAAERNRYLVQEDELNALGYKLLEENKLAQAIAVFELNVTAFPNSPNTYDSLAEAYLLADIPEKAERVLKEALKIEPDFKSAKEKLMNMQQAGR